MEDSQEEASAAEAAGAGKVKKMQRNVAKHSNIPFSYVEFMNVVLYYGRKRKDTGEGLWNIVERLLGIM